MPCPYSWQDDGGMLPMFSSPMLATSLVNQLNGSVPTLNEALFLAELATSSGLTAVQKGTKFYAWKRTCAENPETIIVDASSPGYFYGLPCVIYKNMAFTEMSNGQPINQCLETGSYIGVSVNTWNGFCRGYTKAGGTSSGVDASCLAYGKCGAVLSKGAFAEGQVASMYSMIPFLTGMYANGMMTTGGSINGLFEGQRLAYAWVYDFCVRNPYIQQFKIGLVPPEHQEYLSAFDFMNPSSPTTDVSCFKGTKGATSFYDVFVSKKADEKSPSGLLKPSSDMIQADWYLADYRGCDSLLNTTEQSALYPPSLSGSAFLHIADEYESTGFKTLWETEGCCDSSCKIAHKVFGASVSEIAIS